MPLIVLKKYLKMRINWQLPTDVHFLSGEQLLRLMKMMMPKMRRTQTRVAPKAR